MKNLSSLVLAMLIAVLLCGCASSEPLAPLPPFPPKVTEEQHRIISDVRISLPHRRWMFNAILAKIGHPPYLKRREGQAFGGVHEGTMAKAFAPGVSEHDLKGAGVKEFAFFDGAMTNPHTHESSYWHCRVLVRKGQIIYMETSPATEELFLAYFEKV